MKSLKRKLVFSYGLLILTIFAVSVWSIYHVGNLGPTSRKLFETNVKTAARALREENPDAPIPVDLVTSSASGLDPHITPAAAGFQVKRVAQARGMKEADLRSLVQKHTEGRQFGVLGEARVNVLELNLELDRMVPVR